MSSITAYCSWCFKRTTHVLVGKNRLSRSVYRCSSCQNETLECRFCKNMAKGRAKEVVYKNLKDYSDDFSEAFDELTAHLVDDEAEVKFIPRIAKEVANRWSNELCAEHDGSIASFEKLSLQLEDFDKYRDIFERDSINIGKYSKIGGGLIAGVAIFGPVGYFAAPAMATWAGSVGLLGAASTGTPIATLSGAALTNASLAALGGGSIASGGLGMAGGCLFVSAMGGGLGARQGGVVSNGYFGDIKDFSIRKVKEGRGPGVVFINGFLSQKNQSSKDWESAVNKRFAENPWYYVTWESKSLQDIGELVLGFATDTFGPKAFFKFNKVFVKNGPKPPTWLGFLSKLVKNPWHNAMVKAGMTGILLADLMSRVKSKDGFILMGHSLGARVIHYTLTALSTRSEKIVKDVYLLGGAVCRNDVEDWSKALSVVDGNLFNFYSPNDHTLKFLYQGANFLQSEPVGMGPIAFKQSKVQNHDVSQIVGNDLQNHTYYKNRFPLMLDLLNKNAF